MNEYFALLIGGGIFTFLGGLITLFVMRRKNNAETEKLLSEAEKNKAENKKLIEETERLNIENQNLRTEQMNAMLKQNNELVKAREELKAKLQISNEQNFLLSKELSIRNIESVEKQKKIDELSDRQKKVEELLNTQHKDIVEIKKQTGQLPDQLPGALKHE
jgi:DNA gyrase/topoisomerase IV subunit A